MNTLAHFRKTWNALWAKWRRSDIALHPLGPTPSDALPLEATLQPLVVELLNADGEMAEELFASAQAIRNSEVGKTIDLRAAVDASNVCRVNCAYCPMRRDNLKYVRVNRATVEQIVLAARSAHALGFRQLFLQSGEDLAIVSIVADAVRSILTAHNDWEITLNVGNLNSEHYRILFEAGARKYLIKHETANPVLHEQYRDETLINRVMHMLRAREAGFVIGSGNILGLPGQTDDDLVDDIIFLGRINCTTMISCAPFTPSDELPAPFGCQPPGDFEKTKRFVALLRHAFPSARIPATSNLDSPHYPPRPSGKTGQAEMIDAGANGITVNFTPTEVEKDYGLYDRGFKRHIVDLEKAEQVSRETGLPLALTVS